MVPSIMLKDTGLDLMYHGFEVRNPALASMLISIFGQKGYDISENGIASFKAPFKELYFCQDEIKQFCACLLRKDTLAPRLRPFVDIMNIVLEPLHTELAELEPSNHTSFATVWTLFPCGTTVYSTDQGSEFLGKVTEADYITTPTGDTFQIGVKVLRFNGHSFVWTPKMLHLDSFPGRKLIKELRHAPAEYLDSAVYSRLESRGRKILDLQGLQYRCYNSGALYWEDSKTVRKHNVEGRILVDVSGYQKYRDDDLHRSSAKCESSNRHNEDKDDFNYLRIDAKAGVKRVLGAGSNSSSNSNADANQPGKRTLRKQITESQCQRNKEMMEHREDDLPFLYGLIGGYALEAKLWVEFYVENIEPIIWDNTAYSRLVYNEDQKALVLSFVQHHSFASASSSTANQSPLDNTPERTLAPVEDVISGKGQGLMILLSGSPGTGKTLMAEAVADRTQRPLMSLQAEDLGPDAEKLGTRLKRFLTMAAEWNAIVLLNEADLLMVESERNNHFRNNLVDPFLRELEYFPGILFLTAKFGDAFDSAFCSHISFHLRFHGLSRDTRRQVWRHLVPHREPQPLESATTPVGKDSDQPIQLVAAEGEDKQEDGKVPTLSKAEFDELSLWDLNGREIKNTVKMVRTWCDRDRCPMTLDRLESGIRVINPDARQDSGIVLVSDSARDELEGSLELEKSSVASY